MNHLPCQTLDQRRPAARFAVDRPPELLLLTAALAAPAALAGSLDVEPVRIELAAPDDVGAVTFRNQGGASMAIQAQPTSWSQTAGRNDFVATDELIVSPPVFTLEPGDEQLVRVGLRGSIDRSSERAYRVFFTELPAAAPAEMVSLKVHLSLAIPVFLAPEKRLQPPLEWSLTVAADDRVEIGLRNTGNEHVQVKQIVLKETITERELGTGSALGYVLAGQERRWTIAADVDTDDWTAAPEGFILSVLTDRVPSVSDWPVDRP